MPGMARKQHCLRPDNHFIDDLARMYYVASLFSDFYEITFSFDKLEQRQRLNQRSHSWDGYFGSRWKLDSSQLSG